MPTYLIVDLSEGAGSTEIFIERMVRSLPKDGG